MSTAPGATRSSVAARVAITVCLAKLRRTRSPLNAGSLATTTLHANAMSGHVGDDAPGQRPMEMRGAQDSPAFLADAATYDVEKAATDLAIGLDLGFAEKAGAPEHDPR